MLPSNISQYLPHTGLFFLLLSVIFIIVSTTSYPTNTTPGDTSIVLKYQSLATIFAAVGGFLLLGPIH
jgi:hypothetical protein